MISQEDINAMKDTYAYWGEEDESMEIKDLVKEFARLAAQSPSAGLYAALIQEEFDEWRSSYLHEDHLNQLKELADLVYVVYGYANAMGWDLSEALLRVHDNNLGRITQDDGTIQRREDGKIIKNPNAPKINLEDLI